MCQNDLPGPGDELAGRELVNEVRDRLPESDRRILEAWILGKAWDEIAKELGGTPEALRKRLSRSIDQVAVQLGLVEESA